MSDKKKVLMVMLVVLFIIPVVLAQDFSVYIAGGSGRLCPGSTGLFTDVVENTGSEDLDFTISSSGTASIFSTFIPQGFSLSPGGKKTIFTYVTPKSSTSIGNYNLDLVVSGDGKTETVPHPIIIEDCFNYDFTALESVKHACPCGSEKFEFVLVNMGNYDETYTLTVEGEKASSVTLSENKFSVPAGSEKRIYAYVVASCTDTAKNYDFTISVTPKFGHAVKNAMATLIVDPCYDFSINTQKDLISLCEHTTEISEIEVSNDGSTLNRYTLEIEGPEWAKLDKNSLDVNAGGIGKVNLVLNPDYGVQGDFLVKFRAITEKGSVIANNQFSINVRDCYAVFVDIEKETEKICNSLENVYSVEVENIGEFEKDFNVEVLGPEWVSIDKRSLSLLPGGKDLINLAISPTSDVVPSTYQVKVKVSAKDSDKVMAEDSIDVTTVTREECYQASVIPNKKDILVYYDSTATIPVVIENKGTYKATYNLAVSGTSSNFVYLNPAVVEVEAGKAELVYLYIAPSGQIKDGTYLATISARLGDSTILASETINIQITQSVVTEEVVKEEVEKIGFFQRIKNFFAKLFKKEPKNETIILPEEVQNVTEETPENITEEVVKEPIVVEVKEINLEKNEKTNLISSLDEEAKLLINGEEHKIKVNELDKNGVTIQINSEPVYATLNIGESKEVDINNDGINDLKVTLNGFVNGKADLSYEKIIQKEVVIEENVTEKNITNVTEEVVKEPIVEEEVISEKKTFDVKAENYKYNVKEIKVNKGDEVEITFSSIDQDYSFAIDEYNIDVTVLKGETDTFSFKADKTGEFNFYCSMPCGEKGEERKDVSGILNVLGKGTTKEVREETTTGEEKEVPSFIEWILMRKILIIGILVVIILIIIAIKSNFHKKLIDFFEEEIEEEKIEKPSEKATEKKVEVKKVEPKKEEVKKEIPKKEKIQEKKEIKKESKEKKYI